MRKKKDNNNKLKNLNLFFDLYEEKVDFSAICKYIRKSFGVTQKEMAQALNVELRNYQGWEGGEYTPSSVPAFKLCALFLCAKEEITKQENANNSSNQEKVA